MKRIRLIPKQNVYLNAFGYGDDRRFARLFREGWAMLPLHARRSILKYWRAYPNPFGPCIEMLLFWGGQETFDTPESKISSFVAVGQCCFRGQSVKFWAVVIDEMPDELVPLIVAHELAHVHSYAIGTDCACKDTQERADRAKLKAWGIDERPWHRWKNGKSLSRWERLAEERWNQHCGEE